MTVFRKIPVWIVLASYLFANTLASSWHDHRDCNGHSDGAHHHTADCTAADSHRSGEHCCHHHHGHKHGAGQQEHAHHTRQNLGPCHNRPSHPPGSHPTGQEHDGDGQHDSQHCVVCEFLALAPLSSPQATLDLAGEVLPEVVVLHVLPVLSTTVETHLARGPPAV